MSSRGVDSSSAEEQLASDAWREGLDALGAGAAGCWGPSALGPPPPPPHPCNPPAAAPAGHWEPPLDALLSEDWDWSCTNLQACEPNWPGAAAPPALASADGRQRRSADPSSSSSQGAAPCPAQGSSGGASRYDRPGARERKREQQREYRARIKARADEQQARLATAEALLAQARQERHALQAEQLALQQLVQYKAEVGEAVAGHVAADAPAAAAAAAARAGDGREWEDPAWLDQLANSCLTGVPEAAIRAAQTCAAWYLRRHEEGNPLSLMGYGANFLRKLGTQLITAAEVLAVTVAERLAPRATPALLEARQRDFCSVVKSAVEEVRRCMCRHGEASLPMSSCSACPRASLPSLALLAALPTPCRTASPACSGTATPRAVGAWSSSCRCCGPSG